MESRFQPEQTLFQLFSSIKDSHDNVSCIAMKISVACPYELHSFALCQGCDTTLLDSRLVGQVFDKRWPWHCDTCWFALVLHRLDNPTMHYDSSNAWILSIKDNHDTVEYSKNTWDICPPLGHWAWCELSNVSWTPARRQCALPLPIFTSEGMHPSDGIDSSPSMTSRKWVTTLMAIFRWTPAAEV